jgi:hypothetical protein
LLFALSYHHFYKTIFQYHPYFSTPCTYFLKLYNKEKLHSAITYINVNY